MTHAPGWYLGLRYMRGTGIVVRVAEPIEAPHRGAQFIYGDRVLGQAPDWRCVLRDWWQALGPRGCLILWLPDCRFCDVEKGAARFTLDDVEHALDEEDGWQLHEADLIDGHIYVVWQKHGDARRMRTPWRKQPRHAIVARTGAYGDALMAASVLPWLKEQGFAVSFITREAGAEVLKHDPHIDELITLTSGQLADEEMPYYWRAWEQRCDRFINLTFSIEGELLKQPTRPDYFWTAEQRRTMCNRSYLRHLHKLADVPGPLRPCFYPGASEKLLAARQASGYGRFVLWCLRGSAVHKWWPHAPEAVCQLLAKTDLRIVLSGDDEAKPLADDIMKAARRYYGDGGRVHNLAGAQSIRAIMTLAHYAAVAVGPETGVMNALALQPVAKVVLLSHSSPANLTDDWCNAVALTPEAPCYPCHRLHYGHEWCPQDKATGAAACAASITTTRVVNAVIDAAQQPAAEPWWLRGENLTRAA